MEAQPQGAGMENTDRGVTPDSAVDPDAVLDPLAAPKSSVTLKWKRGNDVMIESDDDSDPIPDGTGVKFVIAPASPPGAAPVLIRTTDPGDGVVVGGGKIFIDLPRSITLTNPPVGTWAHETTRTTGGVRTLNSGLAVVEEPVGGP